MSANLPRMEALVRISNIPLVETGTKTAGNIYNGLKQRSGLLNWGFGTAENVLGSVLESVRPAVRIVEGPLQRFDQFLCGGLDAVEHRVPSIYLPPRMIYSNTKEYMSDVLIGPVLKRADSIKHIGSSVLDNRVSSYAADRIDRAIDAADVYVEKYLPSEDQVDSAQSDDDNENKAIHTFHRSQRFSRKLKRRLTQRTVAEARAFKKHGKEAIHICIYAAELIATDPKMAYQKAHELWAYLSKDEPENQHRPETIEELLVLLTRESARRMVHLVNYGGVVAKQLPSTIRDMLHQFTDATTSMTRSVHFDRFKCSPIGEFYSAVSKITELTGLLQFCSTDALERLAHIMVGRSTENSANCKDTKKPRKHHRHGNNTDANAKRANHENGI